MDILEAKNTINEKNCTLPVIESAYKQWLGFAATLLMLPVRIYQYSKMETH